MAIKILHTFSGFLCGLFFIYALTFHTLAFNSLVNWMDDTFGLPLAEMYVTVTGQAK